MYPAFKCKCGSVFSRRDNLFQHMRSKGCVVWYKNGVRQGEPDEETKAKEAAEAAAEMAKEDNRRIARIIADGKKAQNRFWKQAKSGF